MGILVSIGWIIFGILYIIYKFGEEELNQGAVGGIGCVFAAVAAFLLLGGFAGFCLAVTDNDADAGLLAWGIILSIIIIGFIIHHKKVANKRKRADQSVENKEADHDHKGF